jgi:hypothetical protein
MKKKHFFSTVFIIVILLSGCATNQAPLQLTASTCLDCSRLLSVKEQSLNAQKATYDNQLGRAAREALRTASVLCQKLNDDNQRLMAKEKNYVDLNCKQATSKYKGFCNKIQLEHNREIYKQSKVFYADAILNLSGFNLNVVKQQKERWVQEIETKKFTHIKPYPDLVYTQVEQYVKTNKTEIENWNKSCTNIKP